MTLSVGACERNSDKSNVPGERPQTVVEPETRVDTVPQEEPAIARSQWRAANEDARSVTGNLRVSLQGRRGGPLVFAFATGVTVVGQPYNVVPADSRSGVGGQSFAAVLGGDPRVETYLYRVESENVTPSAPHGGLCGEAVTRHLAVSEFVDGAGRWVFKIAAFSGDARPPSSSDPQLCNAYAYTAQ
ncbi:hypothetical protein ATE48_10845 [Candidatus Viadribacter manganicus]|uniref:Uncharacterized protein n=2 Tax=Candidatus Viadribacter manganicus TaxID=1759059 RepID=A0A1B1AII2_9PROT|nr:hypothetical protein ATE48_10845 [Candidatus Viadribacter manganicus]